MQVLENNPYICRIIGFNGNLTEISLRLRKENYDLIIDLHKNLRSIFLRIMLTKPSVSFKKLNFRKWLMVRFKIKCLPQKHLVERYFEALKKFGVNNDFQGCDFYLDESSIEKADQILAEAKLTEFYTIVLSGTYYTKRLPNEKILQIIELLEFPVVLLGGRDECKIASEIIAETGKQVLNLCGKTDIKLSAAIIYRSKAILTGDTGMMHIATALDKKTITVWGNTIPEFGMFPYRGGEHPWALRQHIFEVKGLKCRPCSKLGKNACPRKHFRCMNDQDVSLIAEAMKN